MGGLGGVGRGRLGGERHEGKGGQVGWEGGERKGGEENGKCRGGDSYRKGTREGKGKQRVRKRYTEKWWRYERKEVKEWNGNGQIEGKGKGLLPCRKEKVRESKERKLL